MALDSSEWLDILRREYLEGFIRDGGAAVKFAVVGDVGAAETLAGHLHEAARAGDYLVAHVDAARVKLHLMQDLFHAVARQIDWDDLARRIVTSLYRNAGWEVPHGDLRVESVAAHNNVDVGPLRVELRRGMEELLRRSHELSKDFRYAMLWLCMAQVASNGQGPDADTVKDWLRGDLRLISAMKRFLIFRKIGRHNARAMLSSLSACCRLAGLSGLVLVLDIRQFSVARRQDAAEGDNYFTPAAVMDAYEVLRQLIDSTDDLRGMLAVVIADPSLFDDERRGVRVYKALYERVWPDVRLKQRPNPLSSLAQLGGSEGAS